MTDFNAIAERVSTNLLARLKAGEIPSIDIETIRAAIRLDQDNPRGVLWATELERLEELTTRRLVEKVG